jgi:hypothetical protein
MQLLHASPTVIWNMYPFDATRSEAHGMADELQLCLSADPMSSICSSSRRRRKGSWLCRSSWRWPMQRARSPLGNSARLSGPRGTCAWMPAQICHRMGMRHQVLGRPSHTGSGPSCPRCCPPRMSKSRSQSRSRRSLAQSFAAPSLRRCRCFGPLRLQSQPPPRAWHRWCYRFPPRLLRLMESRGASTGL